MLYLAMPLGPRHGWGVCSRYLARELAAHFPLKVVAEEFTPAVAGSPLDFAYLAPLVVPLARLDEALAAAPAAASLQALVNDTLRPLAPGLAAGRRVGYVFFEQTSFAPADLRAAEAGLDLVVGGSSWCSELLRARGLGRVATVVQGVDRALFNPVENQKTMFRDRFVVFSGGKLELRKGQDLVVRGMKVLMERHRDVMLVAAWHNPWPQYAKTLAAAPGVRFRLGPDPLTTARQFLADNGLDPARVLALPALAQHELAQVYKNSDLGLFPNRCEGGTNLVLMEYLACGKPAVVSYSSGHRDVVSEDNALLLRRFKPMALGREGRVRAVWDDPDLDEVVERLEWAYQHPGELAELGRRAGTSMEPFTWREVAARWAALLGPA